MSNEDRKPETHSTAHQWHEFSFKLSIDRDVDWDSFDVAHWARVVARFTSHLMAKTDSTISEDELTVVRASLMNAQVSQVDLITDDGLHSLIDEFEG